MSFFIIENLCHTFWWSFGRTRFGFGGCCSGCSLLPSRSLRVVQVAPAFVSGDSWDCWATSGRVSGWPKAWRQTCHAVAGRRIPSHILVKTGMDCRCDTERRRQGSRCSESAAAAGRRGACTGAGLCCLEPAGPSITERLAGGIKNHTLCAMKLLITILHNFYH